MPPFHPAPRLERRFDHYVGTDPDTGERFLFFWKTESPFSQWHPSPFTFDGRAYFCAEQWMMAAKAIVFGDETALGKILAATDPGKQKALGRTVQGFDEAVWSERSLDAVYIGSYLKFQGALAPSLARTTGFTLVEASPLDRIWGIGLGDDAPEAYLRSSWRGENRLGRILGELRDDVVVGRARERFVGCLQRLRLSGT